MFLSSVRTAHMQLLRKQPCVASGEFFHPFITVAQAEEILPLPARDQKCAAPVAASGAASGSRQAVFCILA